MLKLPSSFFHTGAVPTVAQWECTPWSAGMWLGRLKAAVIWLSARERAASKVGWGWVGGWTCSQVLLKGLTASNRKHHQTNAPHNITEIRSTELRLASWLSLSNMTNSEVISVYVVQCVSERRGGWEHIKGGGSQSPFLAVCSHISPHGFTAASNAEFFFIHNVPLGIRLWKGSQSSENSLFLMIQTIPIWFFNKSSLLHVETTH